MRLHETWSAPLRALLALLLVLSVGAVFNADGAFFQWSTHSAMLRQASVHGILACGMTLVIVTAGIDLSIGSMLALCAMILGGQMTHGVPVVIAVLGTIVAGALLGGGINGMLVAKAKLSFFVVTLGTLSIYQSIALLTTNGETVSLFAYARFNEIPTLINGETGPFPTVLLLFGGLYLIGALALHYTSFGRAVYAVGSNPEAARLTGINVRGVLIAVYTIAGLSAGFAAIVSTGRLTAAGPQVDTNLMLNVIAAVLIGGTAFTGGDGGLLGTIIGVLFLGLIQNGLQLSNISTFWQGAVSGAILIVAVGLGVLRDHALRARLRNARRRRAGVEPT